MQANPVLKDFSGNGHDAACYNFAWSGNSGIGGVIEDFTSSYYENFLNDRRGKGTVTYNKIHITQVNDNSLNIRFFEINSPSYEGQGSKSYKIRVTGVEPNRPLAFSGAIVSGSDIPSETLVLIDHDGEYTIPETDYSKIRHCGYRAEGWTGECNITIEQLPQYPGALVYDGVDDYVMYTQSLEDVQFPGYTMIYKMIVFRDKQYGSQLSLGGKDVKIASIGNYLASKVERIESYGRRTDFPEKPEYYDTVRTVYQSTYSFDGIQELIAFEEYIPAVGADHDGIRLGSALGSGSVSKIVLYSFVLFNRDLTTDEIDWVKTNLIE